MFSRVFGRLFPCKSNRDYELLQQENLLLTQELSKKTLALDELTASHTITQQSFQLKIKQLQHEIELQTGSNIKKSETIKLLQTKCEELETAQRCLRKREMTSAMEKVLCRYMSRNFKVDITKFGERHKSTQQTTRLCRLLDRMCCNIREEGNYYAHNACVSDDAVCEKTLRAMLDEMIHHVEADTDSVEFLKMLRTTKQFWQECMDIIQKKRRTSRFVRQVGAFA